MGVINSVNGNLNVAKNNNDVNVEVADIEDIEDKKSDVSYVKKNNTDVEDFDVYGNDITSLTPEQIESLVGTMTPEDYEDFIAGINKHYDNQIEYANTVIYGEGGYKELYDELSDKLSFVEEDYLHQVQIYYNELHELWENTDSLKNSGITYEEFEKMTSDEQAEFVKDKSDEASKKIEEIKNYKSEYDTGVKTEYPDLGVETFDDLIKVKNQLAQTIEQTDEDIEMLKNKKESAKYDYIYFTKDYKDYEFKTEFTEADIATLEFCKNGSEYDYDAYHEKYPNISITEFYMMVYEDDSNGKVYTSENTSVYVDKVAKLSKVNPSLAKTYQYIYDKDPNEAYDFIKDCGDEINKCQGMLDAQDFLDKYMLDEEGGIDAICNELNITREGLMDGLDTFVDGIYYSGEAIATLFGFSEENRVKSADEYKKMYLLYSLMSKEDKIKYGLITYDEDGNLVNTNPNSVIDFTKSYDGLMLDANYQLSQGIGNIAPSIAINYVLPGAGNVAMGVSAGGNAYHISMVEGNGVLDSIGYGIFTGTSEAISEKVLGGIQGLSDVEIKSFKDFLASMGKEGIQESYQEIMDVVYRCTFMGEKLPESPEEWEELIHQVGVAGTYGMVTAGVLNSSSLMARVNLSGKNDVNTNTDINVNTDIETKTTSTKFSNLMDNIKKIDNNKGCTNIYGIIYEKIAAVFNLTSNKGNSTNNITTDIKKTDVKSVNANDLIAVFKEKGYSEVEAHQVVDLMDNNEVVEALNNTETIPTRDSVMNKMKTSCLNDLDQLVLNMTKEKGIDTNQALEYIVDYVNENIDVEDLTDNIELQDAILKYDPEVLILALNQYGSDLNQWIVNVDYTINMFQSKQGMTYEEALNQIKSYIETGDANRITSYGDARTYITSMRIEDVKAAYDILYKNHNNTYVNTATVNQASIDLKNEIVATVNQDDSDFIKARKAYIELNKRINYDPTYHKVDDNTKNQIFNSVKSFNDLDGTSVVCSGWSYLYAEVLQEVGIPASNITIQGGTGHKWVEIKLNDGNIIIADATDVINHSTDLSSCKSGFQTNGFLYISSDYSGRRLSKIADKNISEAPNTQFRNIDKYLGYAAPNGDYANETIEKLAQFKNNSKDKNLISNIDNPSEFIFNNPLPENMDGYDACSYYNKVTRLLESDRYDYNVNVLYKELPDGKYEAITVVMEYDSETGDKKYMLIGKNIGRLTFDTYKEYQNYIDTNIRSD